MTFCLEGRKKRGKKEKHAGFHHFLLIAQCVQRFFSEGGGEVKRRDHVKNSLETEEWIIVIKDLSSIRHSSLASADHVRDLNLVIGGSTFGSFHIMRHG